ncbi:response regulator [Enemella sp. A6]|uniref:response regulator n=1 Tax=Enemella sp. A6 TaxID=3440152 RepID=UPI003EBE3F1A
MGDVIRLLVIDDDPLVRGGLQLMLGGDADLQIVAEGSDGDEAVALVTEHSPDVVLMDIRMPRMDGLAALAQVNALPDPPKVIILTTFDADDMVLRALAGGAAGFLLKDTSPDKMIEAIHQVAAGEHTLSPTIVAQVIQLATSQGISPKRDAARQDLATLTDRERDVAVLIGRGRTNAEIAKAQFMSVATVKAHVTRILEKLGMTSRVQIALKVHDAELNQPDG